MKLFWTWQKLALLYLALLILLFWAYSCATQLPIDSPAPTTEVTTQGHRNVTLTDNSVADAWQGRLATLLLGTTAVLLILSYPIGKFSWLIGSRLKNGKNNGKNTK